MKRALVLSGGGSKGAYSVGVLKALVESGRTYDVVAGVSVGSLIGSHMAMYPPEKQAENFPKLEQIWTEEVKGNDSVYKPWAPWILKYIWSFWTGGLYSMRPLRDIVAKQLDLEALKTSGVEFEVGVTSLQSGEYKSINLSSDPEKHKNAVDWIWASCVFPMMFTAVEIDGEQWVDGGVRNVIPLVDVLKYPEVTEIDVILTDSKKGYVHTNPKIYKSALDVGLRTAELLSEEIYVNDLKVQCGLHGITLNIYDPSESVNADSFTFDPTEIKSAIEKGYKETKEKLTNK